MTTSISPSLRARAAYPRLQRLAVRLGELLLKEKRITPEQLQEALAQQRQKGGKLGFTLVSMGFVKESEITALLSKQFGVPSIAISQFEMSRRPASGIWGTSAPIKSLSGGIVGMSKVRTLIRSAIAKAPFSVLPAGVE